ncbi:MAG: DUF4142 domain-containing protein, partial [Gammaproteobacteria bacterium]|nr:DUF4142 domain-containing protein [Gammaproteobacteria bacterium]
HNNAASRLAAAGAGNRSKNEPLDPDHQVVLDQLNRVGAEGFDAAYVRSQVVDHQMAVQLYQWVISNGQNTKIKAYAIETLPVLLQHLQMTKDLQATLTGSAP